MAPSEWVHAEDPRRAEPSEMSGVTPQIPIDRRRELRYV